MNHIVRCLVVDNESKETMFKIKRMNQYERCLKMWNESIQKMINYMEMIHSNEGLSSRKRIKEKKV